MSGRNRKFRRRGDEDADAGEPEGLGMPPASVLAARRAKEKEKKAAKKPPLLSFEEDEPGSPPKRPGGDARARDKPRAKLKPNLQGLSLAEDGKAPHRSQQSAAGEYSAERLQELRANAKSFTGVRAPMSSVHGPAEDSGGFKLSGSFKPAGQKPAAAASQEPVASSSADAELLPPPARPKPAAAAPPPQPAAEDEPDSFHVPSAEMIRLARQKRERLRSAHLAPDYVPLGGAAGLASLEARLRPDGATGGSEDGSGSDAEEGRDQRMQFVGEPRGGSALPGVLGTVAREPEAHGGEEEDDDSWVREQIRKGVGGGAGPSGRTPAAAGLTADVGGRRQPSGLAAGGAAGAAFSGEAALKALAQSLARLKAKQANIDKQAARTQESMRSSMQAVARLQAELAAASGKYTFLQDLRSYVADLCGMLQDKAAVVEELEEHLMEAAAGRAAAAAERAAADEAAELEPASAAVSAALGVLSRGGEPAAASEAAAAAVADAEARANGGGAVQLDEFGRDVGLEAGRETSARQERLERRDARWQGDPEGAGGAETSGESEGEAAQYARRRREVLDTASRVFADADAEYGTLPGVKARLQRWRREQPGAWASAYAADSAPAIFAPFVRNELLAWEPVLPSGVEFDAQGWYQQLLDFSAGDAAGGDDLIPTLVGNLVVPLALHALKACWNPFSRRQTQRVVQLLDHLLVFLPVEEPRIQELLAEVQRRLEAAAGQLRLPPWPQAAVAAAPRAAALLAHRFGKALRLLANIAAFDSLLPRAPLLALAFDRMLQPQLLPYVAGASSYEAAAVRGARLAEALPQAWLQQARARPLAETLCRTARALEGRQGGRPDAAVAARLAAALTRVGEPGAAGNLRQALGLR